jgi:hypothetical protein
MVKPDSDSVYVITPTPKNVTAYDSSIAKQWQRTFNHCSQTRKAIAIELSQRKERVSGRRSLFLSIGGLAGLANAIYTGIQDDPKKDITVPLSIISGSALLTFLPSLIEDERVEMLSNKLERLNDLQIKAENALYNLDTEVSVIGKLQEQLKKENNEEERKILKLKLNDLFMKAEVLIGVLKRALTAWSNEAQ